MKKKLLLMALVALCLWVSTGIAVEALDRDRLLTLETVEKLTDYEELNVYTMEVLYDYDLDGLTPAGLYDNQRMLELILEQALPGMPVNITAPDFGCTAFAFTGTDGHVYMGRNYDFKFDTSAMLVYCHPKDGYASVAHAALSNLGANTPDRSESQMAACLASPFVCLDGMNEKGVAIAVLTLSSEPTRQDTGKPVLATPVLIRLVLDRAASADEAVELISQYDYFATSGRDYHYYIADASGAGYVVEFDCEREDRALTVTPLRTITNYYAMYEDRVLPFQANGIYGRGMERRDRAEAVMEAADCMDGGTAWAALKAASTAPDPESIISNTQWSAVFDLTELTHTFVLHRLWEDVFAFDYHLNQR